MKKNIDKSFYECVDFIPDGACFYTENAPDAFKAPVDMNIDADELVAHGITYVTYKFIDGDINVESVKQK